MADAFRSPRLKIARSKKHVADIEKKLRLFKDGQPFKHVAEADPDTPERTLHIRRLAREVPQSISLVVGEAVNCLREALDNAGYAIAVSSGKTDPKSCYFPFAQDGAELEKVIRGRCKDIPPEIIDVFRRLQPYKGGNDLLWALNKVNTGNKHRMLTWVSEVKKAVDAIEAEAQRLGIVGIRAAVS